MFTPWIVVVVVTIQTLGGDARDIRLEAKNSYPLYEMCMKHMKVDAMLTVMKLDVIKDVLFKGSTKITMKEMSCEKKRIVYREAKR